MMPKTSVRPAAIRNSITPSCSPLSVCSRTRIRFKGGGTKKGRGSFRAPGLRCVPGRPLSQGAFLVVGILVVGEDRLLDFHHRILAGRPGSGDGNPEDGLHQPQGFLLQGMPLEIAGGRERIEAPGRGTIRAPFLSLLP